MNRRCVPPCAVLLVMLTACPGQGLNNGIRLSPPTSVEPGWRFYPSPFHNENIGSIIGVDTRTGTREVVDRLEVSPQSSPTGTVNRTFLQVAEDELGLQLLEGKVLDGQRERVRRMEGTLSLRNTETQTLTVAEICRQLSSLLPRISREPGRRYYVVAGVVLAKGVDYSVSRSSVDSMDIRSELVAKGARLSRDDHGAERYTMTDTFPMPMPIMYRPFDLRRLGSGNLGGTVAIEDIVLQDPATGATGACGSGAK
jgi:hypothetical protein